MSPHGCTYVYASPQQLRARQRKLEYDWSDSSSSAAKSAKKGNNLVWRLASLLKKSKLFGRNVKPAVTGGQKKDEGRRDSLAHSLH